MCEYKRNNAVTYLQPLNESTTKPLHKHKCLQTHARPHLPGVLVVVGQRVLHPVHVVTVREILSRVGTAAFLPRRRRVHSTGGLDRGQGRAGGAGRRERYSEAWGEVAGGRGGPRRTWLSRFCSSKVSTKSLFQMRLRSVVLMSPILLTT